MGEPVPAVRTPFLPARTGILAELRCSPGAVHRVPSAGLHQGSHQTAHRLQIHLPADVVACARRLHPASLRENAIQQRSQTRALWHTTDHDRRLHIVRPHLLIPEEALLAVRRETRVPFRDLVLEELPHLRLQRLPPVLAARRRLARQLLIPRKSGCILPQLGLLLRASRRQRSRRRSGNSGGRRRPGSRGLAIAVGQPRGRLRRLTVLVLDARIPGAESKTVRVRVPRPGARLGASESQEGMRLGMRHYGGHDDLHEQLCSQRDHEGGDVRRIAHEGPPHRQVHVLGRSHSFLGALRRHVEPVNVVDVIIPTIAAVRRPPQGRRPPEAHGVLHRFAAAQQNLLSLPVLVAHPRRPPRQMLQHGLQLLALVSPEHRRRAHVPPHGHQLVHDETLRLLSLKHLLQTLARQNLLPLEPRAHTTQKHPLHHVALPGGFRQKRSIHQGPGDTVLSVPIHELPRPRTQEVLRVLRGAHLPPPSRLVEAPDAHRELQRESLGLAPGLAWQRRRIGDAGPVPSQSILARDGLRDSLSLLVRIRAIRNSFHRSSVIAETEVLHNAPDLHAQKINQLRRVLSNPRAEVLPHAAPTPLDQGVHGENLPFQDLQLPAVQHDLAVKIEERVVPTKLQSLHHTLLRGRVPSPPLPERGAQGRTAQLQPSDEDLVGNAIDDLVGSNLRVPRCANEGHPQAGLDHLAHLGDVDALHVAALRDQTPRRLLVHDITLPNLRRVALPHLRLGEHVEELRVVILVHRADHAIQTPRPQRRQRLKDTRHDVPTNFQTLQHVAMPDVSAQMDHEIPVQVSRAPRHVHARPHAGRVLAPDAPLETVVLQLKHAVFQHTPHRRGEDQVRAALDAKALPELRRRGRLRLLGSVQVRPWPTARVHAISFAILLHPHHARARREALQILREGNRVAPELLQARLPNLHERHLHVLQSHDHRLRQRRAREELSELLVWKLPTGIHDVQIRTPRNHDVHARLLLLLDVDVTAEAHAPVHLRHQQLRLGLIARTLRQAIPERDVDAASGNAATAALQKLQSQVFRRTERRVERGEALVAPLASEHQHARQDRVHRPHGLQAVVTQHHVELRHADGHLVHRDEQHLPQQLRVRKPLLCGRKVFSAPLLVLPRFHQRHLPSPRREHLRLEPPNRQLRLLDFPM